MAQQLAYAKRWPVRVFIPRINASETRCKYEYNYCLTIAQVEWLAASEVKKRLSLGSSVFGIATNIRNGKIIYINGKMLKVKRLKLDRKGIRKRAKELRAKRYNWQNSH